MLPVLQGGLSRFLGQEHARVADVGPGLVGITGDGDDLFVVLAGLGGIAGLLGGLCRTDIARRGRLGSFFSVASKAARASFGMPLSSSMPA